VVLGVLEQSRPLDFASSDRRCPTPVGRTQDFIALRVVEACRKDRPRGGGERGAEEVPDILVSGGLVVVADRNPRAVVVGAHDTGKQLRDVEGRVTLGCEGVVLVPEMGNRDDQ
jgi:hypothetical protein